MKKKIPFIILAIIMLSVIMPTTSSRAANIYYLSTDYWSYDTFDFASKGVQQGDVICIGSAAQNVRLVGSTSVTYYDVIIVTESTGGCKFILENLNITGMYGDNTTPLVINGTGNTVEIRGTCNLLAPVDVGIQVESGDEVTFTGSGTLNVRGGYSILKAGAGIGGRYQQNCGTVNIKGSINLSAEGGSYAAAIGGGGGGINAMTWPVTNIIGGSGGSVNISENAVVYASGSSSDIGAGYANSSKGSLSISGNAAVFFSKNDSSILSYTSMSSAHNYTSGGYKFGYSVSGSVGSSITTKSLYTITYDANGGTGSASGTYMQDNTVTLNDGSSFSRAGYTLAGWADSADGIKDYELSDTFALGTSDVTLYAAWAPYDITYDLDGGTNSASNPATYETAGTPIALYSPAKDGCSFMGWYDGSDFTTANLVTEIPSGAAGSLTYYARWNTLPTLKSGISEGASAAVNINTKYSIDMANIFTDADGDALSYLVSVNGAAYASCTQIFSYTPSFIGTIDFVFKANDGLADSAKTHHVILYSTEPAATATKTHSYSSSTATPSPTAEYTATATPASSSISATASPASSFVATSTPAVTATAMAVSITAQVSHGGGDTNVTIYVADLPEGTTAVKLPNGETVSVASAEDGKLVIEVDESLADSGSIELTAINDEQTALGYYSIEVPEETAGSVPLWAWVLGGIFALFWTVYGLGHLFSKKTNPRNVR